MADSAASESTVSPRCSVLEHSLTVCRLEPDSELPVWTTDAPIFCVTRTAGELSVVCPEELVPAGTICDQGHAVV